VLSTGTVFMQIDTVLTAHYIPILYEKLPEHKGQEKIVPVNQSGN